MKKEALIRRLRVRGHRIKENRDGLWADGTLIKNYDYKLEDIFEAIRMRFASVDEYLQMKWR